MSEGLMAYLIIRETLFWGRRGCIFINPSRFLLLVLLCRFCVWRRRSRLRVSVLSFFLPARTSPNRGHIFSRTKQPQKPEHLEKTEFPKITNILGKRFFFLCCDCWLTLPGLNSGNSSVTLGSALAASFCIIPASGRLSLSGAPRIPELWHGRSVSDSESEELLKSTFSPVEDGAMMEGRIMPSPSSPTVMRGGDRF